MKLWRRDRPSEAVVEEAFEAPAIPLMVAAGGREGDRRCSERGCQQCTGLPCEPMAPGVAPCATAWCPEHRIVVGDRVLCPAHAASAVGATAPAPVIGGNAAGTLLRWAVEQIDDEMTVLVGGIALERGERLATESIHFLSPTPSRPAAWARTWEARGAGLHVSAVIEEATPMTLNVLVNAKPVISLPVPWSADHGVGIPPASTAEAERAVEVFGIRFCAAIDWVIEEWYRQTDPRGVPAALPSAELEGHAVALPLAAAS